MNILYLIGNGFDISLGMKTSYNSFYDYYCGLPDEKQNVKVCQLKEAIEKGRENWADLEWTFGQYTKELTDFSDFEQVYYDLSDALVDYLRSEETKFDPARMSKENLLNDLSVPSAALTLADRRHIGIGSPSAVNRINIISFNYTRTIERILDYKNAGLIKGKDSTTAISWQLDQILHVHGTLEEGSTILLGVNDTSQIANPEFAGNEEITDILVKPHSNRVLKQEIDVRCRNLIGNADVIVMFGLSIGATDTVWWQEILQHLASSGAILIIYHFDRKLNIGPNRGQRIGAIERQIRSNFLLQANSRLSESFMRDRIFVGVNTAMFKKVKNSTQK